MRIARRQVKKATEELQSGPDLTDEEVHDVRKRLKKARAALRLLRETIGARRYHRENTALRDAARPFTQIRDAKVLSDTVEKLASDDQLEHAVLDGFKQGFGDLQREVRRQVLEEHDAASAAREALKSAADATRKAKWKAARMVRLGKQPAARLPRRPQRFCDSQREPQYIQPP